MEEAVKTLLAVIRNEGSSAVIALLILMNGYQVYERHQAQKRFDAKDERLHQLLDDYHQGTLTLNETITSFKYMLLEIKAKL